MILKSLYDYACSKADNIPDLGYEYKEIAFVIVIDRGGNFVRFESKRIDKTKCASFEVPKSVNRSSSPIPNILWDNGKYVFGFDESAKECKELFVSMVKKIAAFHPEDRSAIALVKYYDLPEDSQRKRMEQDSLYEDVLKSMSMNFSFRLEEDDMIIAEKKHLLKEVIELSSVDGMVGRCLVTGKQGTIVRLATPTPIPGTSAKAALVSFQKNSGYDSYGKSQAYNAPISEEADFYYAAALKSLLSKDSKNKARLGDRMFLFWTSGQQRLDSEVEEGVLSLLDISDQKNVDSPEKSSKVLKLFKSIYSGEVKTTLDDRFHILGLAPNSGRIAIVMWIDAEIKEFAAHILQHFEDMTLIDYRKPESQKSFFGVYSMISAITRGGKLSDSIPNIAEVVAKSVLEGIDYPFTVYSAAIERIRAELQEHGVSIQRASILKAYLNRKYKRKNNYIKLTEMLDKTNTNPGYLCGRLVAVLEKIQKDANSGDSMRTRYMGAASTTPATVLPSMLNVSVHHSEKLTEGSRIYNEQLKQEIIDKLPVDGFPTHLDLNDQGRFFVGYYHQNAYMYTKKIETNQ